MTLGHLLNLSPQVGREWRGPSPRDPRPSHICHARQTQQEGPNKDHTTVKPTRRAFLSYTAFLLGGTTLAGLGTAALVKPPPTAAALVQFPTTYLRNTYYLVRSGTSYSEERNLTATNPVWKQSGAASLTQAGRVMVVRETLPKLEALGACDEGCWLWPSMTQGSYQTAEALAEGLNLGRSRIVPEYSFLDKRGLGALEDLPLDRTRLQVAEGDAKDSKWRPLPNTDGTPNESMEDVLVRVRQLLSITETQYYGEVILIISPDSYNLSALQAAVLGIDLRSHLEYEMAPGEVRQLQLGAKDYDAAPRRFTCPDPPKCTGMAAALEPDGKQSSSRS